MISDFKNIQFQFVKVSGGASTIDTSMTKNIFYSTKPNGYFECFIFPKKYFAGVDFEDLKNLVDIEEKDVWNNINRDTFLGYNEETNEFICNINAYLGLKDAALKTDGSIGHSGQCAWYLMSLGTTKDADSIITLKQTDGTDAYLSIKKIDTSGSIFPPSCIDNKKKSILGSALIKSNQALFAKSSEDSSVVMVNNYVDDFVNSYSKTTSTLSRDNKEYGATGSISSTYKFGKKIFSFESTSSTNSITNFENNFYIPNKTSSTDIELTYTDNINDILSSDESLTFYLMPEQMYSSYIASNESGAIELKFFISRCPTIRSNLNSRTGNITLNSNKNYKGYPNILISCDSRKPFVYTRTNSFNIDYKGDSSDGTSIIPNEFLKDVPEGVIVLFIQRANIYRFKKGDVPKTKVGSFTKFITSVTGSTQYGIDIFTDDNTAVVANKISKDDLINSIGFTPAVDPDRILDGSSIKSPHTITIYKI